MVRLIHVDEIQADPEQPRQILDRRKMEDLVESIRRRGLLSPIMVRPSGRARPSPQWTVTAGERRFHAIHYLVHVDRLDHLALMPALVTEAKDSAHLFDALVENIVRADLSTFEVAECLRKIKEERGLTNAQIASELNRDEAWVAQRLGIAESIAPEARAEVINWHRLAAGDRRAVGDETDQDSASVTCSTTPSFTLLRSLVGLPSAYQVQAVRDVRERQLVAREADAYVRDFAFRVERVEAARASAPARKMGRPKKTFSIRPLAPDALPMEQRGFTISSGGNLTQVTTVLVDVRNTNVANLIRFTERRRGWKVEPEDFLRELEAAVTADREALCLRTQEVSDASQESSPAHPSS
jgi:ParB/RepB/Spo0J family partition protein